MKVGLDRGFLLDRLADVIASKNAHPRGVVGLIEDGETREGRTLVPLGAKHPFAVPRDDWQSAVISIEGERARIVLVHAHTPGSGALSRLVAAIIGAGLRPAIVEPTGFDMPAIVKKWGWKRHVRGVGWERSEEWMPRVSR